VKPLCPAVVMSHGQNGGSSGMDRVQELIDVVAASASRLPVGSSARSRNGSLTSALARPHAVVLLLKAQRHGLAPVVQPTEVRTWRVRRLISAGLVPVTLSAKATLS